MATNRRLNLPPGFQVETQATRLPEGFEIEKPKSTLPEGFEVEKPKSFRGAGYTGTFEEPMSFGQKLKKGFKMEFEGNEAIKKVPVAGGVVGTMEMSEIASAAGRMENWDYDQWLVKPGARTRATGYQEFGGVKATRVKDEAVVLDYLRKETERAELGGAGIISSGVSNMPTYMAEFAMTGGLAKFGSGAAKLGAKKLLKRYAKTTAGRAAMRAAGWSGAAITRASIGMAPRVTENIAARRVQVNLDPENNETPLQTAFNGWASTVISAAAESAGGSKFLGRTLKNKTKFGKVIMPKLEKAWITSTGGESVDFWRRMSTKVGRAGIFGELGEERLDTIMQAVAGTEDFGAGPDAGIWDRTKAGLVGDMENLGYEVAVLSVFPAGRMAGGRITKLATDYVLRKAEAEQAAQGVLTEKAAKEKVIAVQTQLEAEGMTPENAKKAAHRAAKMSAPETTEAQEEPLGPGQVKVYRSGKLEGQLLNFGSKAAAEAAGKGEVVEGTLNIQKPATLIDSGRSHDKRPVAVAEDLVAGGNKGIQDIIIPVIKNIQKKEGDEAAFKAIYSILQNQGYDGIKYENTNEDAGSTSYVALEGSQFTPKGSESKVKGSKKKRDRPTKTQLGVAHDIASALKIGSKKRRGINEELTGKKSMKKMTQAEGQKVLDEMERLAEEADFDTSSLYEAHAFPTAAGTRFTPSVFRSRQLGVHFMLEPLIRGKMMHYIEHEAMQRKVNAMGKEINKLGGETLKSKAKAKLYNRPTKSIKRFFMLLDKHEEAPAWLSEKETEVFNFFRTLNLNMLARENEVRKELGMELIPTRKAYVRHMATEAAIEMLEGRRAVPSELEYWFRKNSASHVSNPMSNERIEEELGDELNEIFSRDLIAVTNAMVYTALKEININKPLRFYKRLLRANKKKMPASTRIWMESFVNENIMGHQTTRDKDLDKKFREGGIAKMMNHVLKNYNRTVGTRPLTTMLSKIGSLQIHGVMGWRPKQLIRNKFQILQNLMLYKPSSIIKSYFVQNDDTLDSLMEESLFLKTYGGMENLTENSKGLLSRLWLAPFQYTAVTNARRSMKIAYHDTAELITDKKYQKYGWASKERTYDEPKGFYYEEELETLLEEMEFGAGVTQYHYIPMAMPEVFRSKTNMPLTRLQSWWMNYFFKFGAEGINRTFRGKTSTGKMVPPSRRAGMLRYVTMGGSILSALGYGSSFAFGVSPGVPPMADLMLALFDLAKADDDRQRKLAFDRVCRGLAIFMPGYLAIRDVKKILTEEKELKSLFIYEKGLFKEDDNDGKITSRRQK